MPTNLAAVTCLRWLTGSGICHPPERLFASFQRDSTRLVAVHEPAEFGGRHAGWRFSRCLQRGMFILLRANADESRGSLAGLSKDGLDRPTDPPINFLTFIDLLDSLMWHLASWTYQL